LLHIKGILLFLFIPLVLYLFLQHPLGVIPSFLLAVAIMVGHRFVALPFFQRNASHRCYWCGRTANSRKVIKVDNTEIQLCTQDCSGKAKRFFGYTYRNRLFLRIGIFLPLLWYIATMLLNEMGLFAFPEDWNHFIFQFFIAFTVVTISFAYKSGTEPDQPSFPFPIHNPFLIGAKNTLLVFRYVGFWWLAAGLYFLYRQL
jgi:hypothetical protein